MKLGSTHLVPIGLHGGAGWLVPHNHVLCPGSEMVQVQEVVQEVVQVQEEEQEVVQVQEEEQEVVQVQVQDYTRCRCRRCRCRCGCRRWS